ncbi:anion transporter [Gloeocapsopsis dulcis]|uniref:Anion transporter n=1 Tax=Gloeocapsopsis dulcis AAB1 = 1H9 TaxID=1433147 RepID=A0A6N8FRK7_9CHRO|nr:anion transporter [Gloeocapsopsis dulcis]MUL35222.1 anion transporter [Gloeocapsopsis dulcis AAB1 = 1H9]WNN89107.1 anion transporter [Gloeocapsopsis dulcis]
MVNFLQYASIGAIALTYLGLGLGYFPGLRMNRATIALVGSAILIGLGVLSLPEAWQAIDPKTIVFLLSMMVVNANLAYAGFFQVALAFLLRLTRSPFGLLIVLTFGSGFLSAFLLNDTLALVFTPLTLSLTQTLKLNPIPYLLALAAATNIGSVATISGNPQNILIGSFSRIGYVEFARVLAPVAVVGLCLQIALLWWYYPEVRSLKGKPPEVASLQAVSGEATPVSYRIYRPLFIKSVIVTLALLTSFVLGVPLAEAALVAAALLLITRRLKPERVLSEIDWNLLVMFSGLFILTRGTQKLNLLAPFTAWVGDPAGLIAVTAILSNLISNVPAVLLIEPLISQEDTRSWLMLAAGATLAGNLSLFGAVANLITVEAAARLGYKLTFWEHLRFGLPLTVLTLSIVYFWVR